MKLNKKQDLNLKYFFIGIGGVSMSGLAQILKNHGYSVAGSDINPKTKISGIKIFHKHDASNIKGFNVIVYNSAISEDNVELVEAKRMDLKILSRAELLGKISSLYKNVIAISGTHGKTTTTAMIAEIFIKAGFKPTIHLGGISNSIRSNFFIGDKNYFITEACEYKDSFLSLKNKVGVVLNIEPEHLDYFKTKNNIKNSFIKFCYNSFYNVIIKECIEEEYVNIKSKQQTNNLINQANLCLLNDKAKIDKSLIIKKSYDNNKILIKLDKTKKVITFGESGDYQALNIKLEENHKLSYDCFYKNKKLTRIKLNACGLHNITNSLSAIAVARIFKIKLKDIKTGLENFKGVKRRMEIVKQNPLTIHDYAHHPTEIKKTILAIKQSYMNSNIKYDCKNCCIEQHKILLTVFQPHTYSRTAMLKREFIEALKLTDKLILYKTFEAREKKESGMSCLELFNEMKKTNSNIEYYDNIENLKKRILYLQKNNTNLITLILGAGDLYEELKL